MAAFLFSPLVLKTIAVIALLLALFGLKHGYDERRRAEGRLEVRMKEVAPLKQQMANAIQRSTDLALLWAAQVDKTAAATKAAEGERNARFATLADRARSMAGPGIRVPAAFSWLLDDASRAANAATAPAAPIDQPAAAPVPATSEANSPGVSLDPAALAQFQVGAAAAYADAFGQWQACVQFYSGLQGSQPKGTP